jgi:predicted nucleic acid-binding protein
LLLLSQQLTWEELFEEMDRENRSFDGLEGVDSAELIRQGRSVVVDLLIKPPAEVAQIRARLVGERSSHARHLLDVEVTHALRRLLLTGRLTELSARRALRDFAVMGLKRRPHRALLGRGLALRDQLTAYDAVCVAVAEVTGATLLTRDARLARAAGHRARVELV